MLLILGLQWGNALYCMWLSTVRMLVGTINNLYLMFKSRVDKGGRVLNMNNKLLTASV